MADPTGGAPTKLPSVPPAQNVQVPQFEVPFQPVTAADYLKLSQSAYNQQQQQLVSYYNLFAQTAPNTIEFLQGLTDQYGPKAVEQYNMLLEQAAPEYLDVYKGLGGRITEGLEAGYELGPGLTQEMEQAIRAAQTSRGNWLGAAPTAQEAFGMGQASLELYNTRLAQAANFTGLRNPTDMWSNLNQANPVNQLYPLANLAQGFVQNAANTSANVFGTVAGSQSAYNATSANAYGTYVSGLIGAATINNQSAFDRYSAQFDQFLYGQSVNQGLFSQPSVAGGGGGGMGMMGGILGGVGSGIATGVGAAALGAGATGAVGAGVAAAAGAAVAAICWVARLVIPDRWREFRRFLFTKAPAWFRTKYIYGGRRLAENLSQDQVARIGEIMCQAISSSERSVA